MQIVAVHNWQKEEAEVAKTIAAALGTVVFEARQKISGGGPAVIASFADPQRAAALAGELSRAGVPALVIDPEAVRDRLQPFRVRRFILEPLAMQLESFAGEACRVDYATVAMLLVASCSSGPTQTTESVTERKFSMGKTLMAGGLPMTKKVTREQTVTSEVRCETLRLYSREAKIFIFDRAALNYDGLGNAMQFTRDLNFAYLKKELRRLAPQALFDDRLLNRAKLARILGPALDPHNNLDLAFEVLAASLRGSNAGQ